jgi:hypothetical protein
MLAMLLMMTNSLELNASPVRVWGDISSVYRSRDFDRGESQVTEWLNLASINASSYIWQPWFALINGGLTYSVDDFNASDQPSVKDKFITGNIQFDLFPGSRFPFSAYVNRSRNELDDDLFARDISNTELGLTQQYRSLSGRHHYRTTYKRNVLDDSSIGNFISDSLQLSSSNQFENQVLHAEAQYDRVSSEIAGDEAISLALTGRQSYDGFEYINIENLVSSSSIHNDFDTRSSEIQTNQFSSLMSWSPAGRDDMNFTASLRLLKLQFNSEFDDNSFSANTATQQENYSLNINQGLNYSISDHVLISESINGLYTRSQTQDFFTGNETVGISYTPASIDTILGYYHWSFVSSLNNQHGDVETDQSLTNQFSHSLSENFALAENSLLQADITQSFLADYRFENESAETLDHSLSVSWTESSTRANSVVRFLFTDSNTQGVEDRSFQLFNLQLSGQYRFNRFSSLSANLTFQRTNQQIDQQHTVHRVNNGQLDFTRKRLFQIPRLNFRSELQFSQQQSESERIISTFSSDETEHDISWENNLDYMIGRFESRLSLDFIKNDGQYDRLIKIQFTRSFGDL